MKGATGERELDELIAALPGAAVSVRWQLSKLIATTLEKGQINDDDAAFLLWLVEHKQCVFQMPSSSVNLVKLTDREVRTLLFHYRAFRNPGQFTSINEWPDRKGWPITQPAQEQRVDRLVKY